jgi:hypothetical protein
MYRERLSRGSAADPFDISEWRSYQAFSYYCRFTDWLAITYAVAAELARSNLHNRKLRLLDVGSGPCASTNIVSKQLLDHFGKESSWDVVEPLEELIYSAQFVMQGDGERNGIRNRYQNLDLVPADTYGGYDAILFMHSTYYIHDLHGILDKVIARRWGLNTALIFLALPKSSAFFLGQEPLVYNNAAEDVEQECRKRNFRVHKHILRSHIDLTQERLNDESLLPMYEFVTGGRLTRQEFIKLVRTRWHNSPDFADILLTVNA